MRIGLKAVGVICLGFSLVVGCASMRHEDDAHERVIAMADAPAAVQASIRSAVGNNHLDSLTKETDDGKVVYEANFKANEMKHSVKIAETGEVLEEEMDVQAGDLPSVVREAVMKKYPGAEIARAEMAKSKGETNYEVHVTVGNAKHEVVVEPNGKIEEEDEHGKDHDDED